MNRPDDPELTREILFYCARDREGKPVRITLDELERTFARISRNDLHDHVRIAIKLELLQIDDRRAQRLPRSEASAGFDLINVSLSGLTSKGREYVSHARTPAWRKALNDLRRTGRKATTTVLLKRLLTGD